jgi:argininosuccinate lyase
MADYLVSKGMPFRKAHGVVGQAVSYALEHNKELHDLSLKELQVFSKIIEEDLFEHLTLENMVSRRISAGGTSPKNVEAALNQARDILAAEVKGLPERQDK